MDDRFCHAQDKDFHLYIRKRDCYSLQGIEETEVKDTNSDV